MLKTVSFELHHSSALEKCGMRWIFIYFMLSGIHSLITVHQDPVVVTSLDDDVTLPCELTLSREERLTKVPVLYWEYLKSEQPGMWPKVWPASENYMGRVERLDNDFNSTNKSIRFKSVRWEDSGMYQCKLSIHTARGGSERKKGSGTLLLVHDIISLNTTAEGDRWLQCAVRVSRDPGFVLSVFHVGSKQILKNVSTPLETCDANTSLYVTLSLTVPLTKSGTFECRLHLNSTQKTKETFHYNLTDGQKMYPEPWLLYASMLLVPVTLLLAISTVWLCRC
ncbi:uncharacterized protein LOC115373681 isoform X2 [Myripristis murdjan]|uniref:uncharacterized protein LOC115373681 isoform X2 n=1 Tax=Myripristis murdjan TaxID=586833 RepID=UPI001176120F|nr:uncharacterized protein LOC115373681 isoform X2 [Myripristis murdjan]